LRGDCAGRMHKDRCQITVVWSPSINGVLVYNDHTSRARPLGWKCAVLSSGSCISCRSGSPIQDLLTFCSIIHLACLYCNCRAVVSTSSGNAAPLSKEEGHFLHKLLSWPANYLFPALDISRMLVLSQSAADALAASAGGFEQSQLGSCRSAVPVSQ